MHDTSGRAEQGKVPLLLRIGVAAERLGVSRRTLYRLIDAGEIAAVPVRRSRFIPADEIDRFLQRLRDEAETKRQAARAEVA